MARCGRDITILFIGMWKSIFTEKALRSSQTGRRSNLDLDHVAVVLDPPQSDGNKLTAGLHLGDLRQLLRGELLRPDEGVKLLAVFPVDPDLLVISTVVGGLHVVERNHLSRVSCRKDL
jgi:hypothetical protein